MKKMIVMISAGLVVALLAGSVYAWGHGKGRWHDGCRGNGLQEAISELPPEKRQALADLRQKFIDDAYPLRSAVMEKRQQIRLAMQTSSPDRAKLEGLYDEIDALQKQIRNKRLDYMLEARQIAPEFDFSRAFQGRRGGMKHGMGPDCWKGPGNCYN